jgi:hypothetical protein
VGGLALEGRRGDVAARPAGDGVAMSGELAIPTGDGDRIPLAQASVELRFARPGPTACLAGFDIVRGLARLPLPGGGALSASSIEVVEQPMASIGLDVGRNLLPSDSDWCVPGLGLDCACSDFCLDDVPILRTDAHYLSFDVDTRYVFRVAGVELPSSPGVAATLVLDPRDPYFYLTGSAMGIPGLKLPLNSSAGGFGFSWHDEIPFVPLSTYPFEDAIETFRGGYAARIKLPIFETEFERVKVLLDGTLIASLDPDEDGDHPFLTPALFLASPDLALGANGVFSARFSPFKGASKGKGNAKARPGPQKAPTDKDVQKEGKAAKKSGLGNSLLHIAFDVGAASAVGRVRPDSSDLYLSGRLGDPQSLLPEWMPLPIDAAAGTQMAAYFSSLPDASFVQAEGSLGLDTTVLARWARMEAIAVSLGVAGSLRVDRNGFRVVGTTADRMHPSVEPTSTAGVEALIAPNGVDTYVTLRGGMAVAGEDLHGAALTLSPAGVAITGMLTVGTHALEMRGGFRGTTGHLEGGTRIEIPYEREDTKRKLELLDRILKQSKEVALGERLLADAEQDLERHRRNAQAVAADLAAAIEKVQELDREIASLGAQISGKQRDLAAQLARDCSADYSGCRSCGSCASRCECGALDFACHADCGVCEAGRGLCLADREACRVGNVALCTADRVARIAALGVEVGALETARAAVIAARDVALGVLQPIQAANALALAALATSEATAEAAQAGLAAARAGVAALQSELDRLPAVRGTVVADLTIAIDTGPRGDTKTGKLAASFEGRRIAKGRVDLDATPPVACVTLPLKGMGEICGPL